MTTYKEALRDRLAREWKLPPRTAQAVEDLIELAAIIEAETSCVTNTAVLAAGELIIAMSWKK